MQLPQNVLFGFFPTLQAAGLTSESLSRLYSVPHITRFGNILSGVYKIEGLR